MSLTHRTLLAVSLCSLAIPALAQDAHMAPPKVLQIFQETVKPGKNAAHTAHEQGWPVAFAKAGIKDYYFGLTAVTGGNDALYITPYPSLAALEKSSEAMDNAAGLQASLAKLADKDGDFLSGTRTLIATRQDDLAVGTPGDIGRVHGFFIRTTRVRIGHQPEFVEFMKLVQEGHQKAGIDPHIATYVVSMGVPVPTYMTFRGFRSLAEMDEWPAMNDKMRAALTDEQRQRMDKLAESAFTAREANVYMISPKMSYVSEQSVAADPAFWKTNPVVVAGLWKKSNVAQAGTPKDQKKP